MDCGAGGEDPPLSMFYDFEYECHGVEIAEDALEKAKEYCQKTNSGLNIIKADMRKLPYPDAMFGFVYAYNAIFFMSKVDIKRTISEINRVLKPEGLFYVNFATVEDPNCGPFNERASKLYKSKRFSQFKDDEADSYFKGFQILRKEKIWIEKIVENDVVMQVYVDYIVRKY
ncbi:MAG: class I SAM-dependent methyltransferase [Bacteroidales bacterium]|nr:class I SAM-dependent methyltransferase [Bacteroidales bacterium]